MQEEKIKKKNKIKISDTLILFIVFIILFTVFAFANKQFISYSNISSLLKNLVITGILAIGLTPLMIAGGIDISIGSAVSLISVVIAILYDMGIPLWVSLLAGVVLGSFIGLINGYFIERFNLISIIFTLGMLAILKSIAFVLSDSEAIGVISDGMYNFAFNSFLKIPKPLLVLIGLVFICWIFMRFTRTGVRIYAIGSNIETAELFGIKVKKIRIILYIFAGFTVGIATIVAVAVTGVGTPIQGINILLPTLSAVVLGGISLTGGSGSIFGTILGVLIISVLFNGLTILNLQSFYIRTIQGIALILVVITYELRRKKRQLTR